MFSPGEHLSAQHVGGTRSSLSCDVDILEEEWSRNSRAFYRAFAI